ncbi:MAG: pyridoxamine 5'-phosphate oxidase family protein [Hyphomicrobiales bacterium]
MAKARGAERVWKALEEASSCMLVTRDGGEIRARPMALYARPRQRAVYFLTNARDHKDEEIRANPHVCITVAEGDLFVSVSGKASVSRDTGLIGELWDMAAAAWFDGKDDPDIRVLTVHPEAAEYWDRPNGLVARAKTAAAAMSSSRPDIGTNEKVML